MQKWMASGLLFFLIGCGDPHPYRDFTNTDSSKGESAFQSDSEVCEREKDKHINKIQGREFGFKGSETGYLGCMKMRGWEKSNTS